MPYADYEQRKARSRAYYAENREACRGRMRQYREANPERMAALKVKWNDENREQYRASKRRNECARRARKAGTFVEHVDLDVLMEAHNGVCGICDEPIQGEVHIDHRVPLCKGGEHSYANTQPAHPSCNLPKGGQ
jgi:5-methylcytosine-specific restriction endonuclease McrA